MKKPRNSCLSLLLGFLESEDRNKWLKDRYLRVYVRKSRRMIEGDFLSALDIASIQATFPGKGHGTKFLMEAERISPFAVTFVECVHNERFRGWLVRNGWARVPGEEENFWKKSPCKTSSKPVSP